MSAIRAPLEMADPTPIFETADGNRRVVVIAMKTQLRGRIRRSVTTLLEQGAEVIILGLKSDKDFTVGLDHQRLTVELLEPSSVYIWLTRRQQCAAANRKRWSGLVKQTWPVQFIAGLTRTTKRVAHKASERMILTVRKSVRRLGTALDRAPVATTTELIDAEDTAKRRRLAPTPDLGGLDSLIEHLKVSQRGRWVSLGLIPVAKLILDFMAAVIQLRRLIRLAAWRQARKVRRIAQGERRVPRRARRSAYRTLRRIRRFAIWARLRLLRTRQRVKRRRTLRRQKWRRRSQERRKNRMFQLRHRVLPFHRITRWVDFWRISRAQAIEHRPDFIVSSDLPGLVGANLAAKTLGVPTLTTATSFTSRARACSQWSARCSLQSNAAT